MSPFIFSADLARTDLGRFPRTSTTVGAASDAYAAQLIDEYLAARAAGDGEQMNVIRDHAYAIDPVLVDELDGFDYPAAA